MERNFIENELKKLSFLIEAAKAKLPKLEDGYKRAKEAYEKACTEIEGLESVIRYFERELNNE